MDILHLIDRLEEMAGEARKMPVGGGVVLNRQRLLDLVDRMRVAVPAEVYTAADVLQRREETVNEAEREAARLISEAQAEVERSLQETEIVKAAEARAQEIARSAREHAEEIMRESEVQARLRLDEAQQAAQEQMNEANIYAQQTLQKLEEQLGIFLETVQRGIETLENRARDRLA